MGLNSGHELSKKNVRVRRVTAKRVIFTGDCGERFHIYASDWPDLRDMIDEAINESRRESIYINLSEEPPVVNG